jgi:hypothetical protein
MNIPSIQYANESLRFVPSMQGREYARITFMKRWLMLGLLLFSLAACGSNDEIRTIEANQVVVGTQLADLRITATVEAARALTTVDAVQTRAALAATQSNFLESTLIATGFQAEAIETQRQVILGSSPTPLPSPIVNPESSEAVDLAFAAASPTRPLVTLNAPNPTAAVAGTSDPNALQVGTPYTALGAGQDGCGENMTAVFNSDTAEIYVIVQVANVKANTVTFAARWEREGQAVGPVYDFRPDYDVDELCVWFFVDSTDFEFLTGAYTVTIDVDGVPSSNPVAFVIQ